MRAILTWHSLDRSGSPISVAPEEFRRQVDWLAASNVQVVGVERLLALPDDVDAAALTFDDGFANFAAEAAPVLGTFGFACTMFVVTGHVGGDNRWGGRKDTRVPTLPLLGWDELAGLRDTGVTLAAHTKTHPRLAALDIGALEREIGGAADEMESRLGSRPAGFAYPYGVSGGAADEVVAREYRWACTTQLRALGTRERAHHLPRIDAWYLREPARRAGWGTSQFRAWLWCRRQGRRAGSWLRRASWR
jgi:peptidoglycan/xylan/chitin deacetylase (PgdA/CDA1 family)